MNKITIEFCAEDRARLDKIIEGLEALQPITVTTEPFEGVVVGTAPCGMWAPQEVETPTTAEPEQPTIEPSEPTPAETPAEAQIETPSEADIQSKVVALCTAGKKDEARAIVTAYAPRVGAIPEDKRAEVLAKLTALEG